MNKMMNAIGYKEYLPISDQNSLFDFETEKPQLKEHDLLVKVEATSVNPVDIFTRKGQKDVLLNPKVIGYDAYGTVMEVGSKTDLFNVGDKVFYAGAYDRPGSNSEYQAVDERIVGHAPNKLSIEESAAMPLTALTAWESLFEQMNININDENNSNKSILIINGAGGVGSIATQLAHFAGLKVIATAGNDSTKEWELNHGVDFVVDYHNDLEKQIHDLGYDYVDYILELVNLDYYWSTITNLIAPFGKIVSTTGSGSDLDFSYLKNKMVSFGWEWMYTKSWFQSAKMITQHQILDEVSSLLDDGKIKSTLTKTFKPINAKNLRQATELVENNHMIGKVVIKN